MTSPQRLGKSIFLVTRCLARLLSTFLLLLTLALLLVWIWSHYRSADLQLSFFVNRAPQPPHTLRWSTGSVWAVVKTGQITCGVDSSTYLERDYALARQLRV